MLTKYPMGMVKNAIAWGEPFVFGVPDGKDRDFFLETGLELGETLKVGSPESIRRYAMRHDGSYYGAHLERTFQQRREAALQAMDKVGRQQAARAAMSGYWLAELTVALYNELRNRDSARPNPTRLETCDRNIMQEYE